MKFPEVNRMPLGTSCDFSYDCEALITFVPSDDGDHKSVLVTPERPITLVHEDHNGHVHWFVPGTEMYIDNKHLQPANCVWLEFACKYQKTDSPCLMCDRGEGAWCDVCADYEDYIDRA